MPPEGTIEEKVAMRHEVDLLQGGHFEKIFGTKKIRSIGSDLGGAVKGFKDSVSSNVSNTETNDASIEKQVKSNTKHDDDKTAK